MVSFLPINVGILRGTCADRFGNIYFDHEPIYAETLAIAEAAHNSGGIVIVQVEEIIENYQRPPRSVLIPGILVDAVVIAPSEYTAVISPAPMKSLSRPRVICQSWN